MVTISAGYYGGVSQQMRSLEPVWLQHLDLRLTQGLQTLIVSANCFLGGSGVCLNTYFRRNSMRLVPPAFLPIAFCVCDKRLHSQCGADTGYIEGAQAVTGMYDRDACFVPSIVMRGAGGVLRPGGARS